MAKKSDKKNKGKDNVIEFGRSKRATKINRYFEAQAGECYLCGEQMTLSLGFNNTAEVEHIVPKANQRVRGKYNEAAAGSACNRYKADRPLHEVISNLRHLRLCKSHESNAGAKALNAEKQKTTESDYNHG